MGYAIGRIRVVDFDRFRETFTTRGAAKRKALGSRGSRMLPNADDPSEVIVVFDWDRAGVEAFMADPEAQEIMRSAGLQGPPDWTFAEQAFEQDS